MNGSENWLLLHVEGLVGPPKLFVHVGVLALTRTGLENDSP
jgi:hypothetical protein